MSRIPAEERDFIILETRDMAQGGYDRAFAERELLEWYPQPRFRPFIEYVLRRYYDDAAEHAA